MPTKIEIKGKDLQLLKQGIFAFKKVIIRHKLQKNVRVKPFHITKTQKKHEKEFKRLYNIKQYQRKQKLFNKR